MQTIPVHSIIQSCMCGPIYHMSRIILNEIFEFTINFLIYFVFLKKMRLSHHLFLDGLPNAIDSIFSEYGEYTIYANADTNPSCICAIDKQHLASSIGKGMIYQLKYWRGYCETSVLLVTIIRSIFAFGSTRVRVTCDVRILVLRSAREKLRGF